MNSVKYLADLKTSTAYTSHYVNQYDVNCPSGGGFFRWVQTNNAGVQEIYGFRIIPTTTSLGYWERVIEGAWCVDWFGVMNTAGQGTLGSYGITAPQISTRYNIGGSNTVTINDTYDTAAIKFAFNLMEMNYTYNLSFTNQTYYINSTCNLPLVDISPNVTRAVQFVLLGNSAKLAVHSSAASTQFDMFSRNILDNGDATKQGAQTGLRSAFYIADLCFSGTNTPNCTALHLKATYNSVIERCRFFDWYDGIHLRFCLGAAVKSCLFTVIKNIAINVDTGASSVYPGGWTGATYGGNSQSNSTEIYKCRFWTVDNTAYFVSGGLSAAIAVNGCSGVVIEQPIIEGATAGGSFPWNYGVFFDARGSANVKDFTVNRSHLECRYYTSAIYLNLNGAGKATVNGIYSQYNNTLVHVDDNGQYSKVTVSNVEFVTGSTVFRDDRIGTGGSGESSCYWYFDKVMSIDPADPTNWFTGQLPGGVVSVIQPGGSSPANRMYIFRPFNGAS